jgi:hypothetical protein
MCFAKQNRLGEVLVARDGACDSVRVIPIDE